MDPLILAGMIFSLVVMIMLGSFVLLWPLSRQLAQLLKKRIGEPSPRDVLTREEGEKFAHAIQQLAAGLEALNERQDFVERLLEDRVEEARGELPPGP
jgi:hypothetical protein